MQKITHLYWRGGFGLSPAEWATRRSWSTEEAVADLFRQTSTAGILAEPAAPSVDHRELDKEAIAALHKEERQRIFSMGSEWIYRMADPRQPALVERMSLFWHGHFACRTLNAALAAAQLNTIRKYALGSFRDLVLAMARDVSMIRYLNNQQNRKDSPNENFARELLELFTIGRGHYSEGDIKEAARAFTGWSSNLKGEFVFRSFQHDYGKKTFFGHTDTFDGSDIIDFILERRETAEFISRKIYRYFVNETEDPHIIKALATRFYQSDYDIGGLMRSIFESDWFYHQQNMGTKIKSPVELMAGMIRSLEIRFSNPLALTFVQKALGQMLFNPPNVAGWPGGKTWIDNSTLMLRLNLGAYLLQAVEINLRLKNDPQAQEREGRLGRLKATLNLEPLLALTRGRSDQEAFMLLQNYLLTTPSPAGKAFFDRLLPMTGKEDNWSRVILGLVSLPEYQMC